MSPDGASSVGPGVGIPIYCWHVHIYFLERNAESTRQALASRSAFIDTFSDLVSSSECDAEVTTDALCLWNCQENSTECLNMRPTGPHTYGSWGASMTNAQYGRVVPWVLRAKMAYPALAGILIHPLTAPRGGDTVHTRARDHRMGLWTREVPLDYDFLDHNVYDCSICDPDHCRQACPP